MDWFIERAYLDAKEVVKYRDKAKDHRHDYDTRLHWDHQSMRAEDRVIQCAESVMRRLNTFGCLGNLFD